MIQSIGKKYLSVDSIEWWKDGIFWFSFGFPENKLSD